MTRFLSSFHSRVRTLSASLTASTHLRTLGPSRFASTAYLSALAARARAVTSLARTFCARAGTNCVTAAPLRAVRTVAALFLVVALVSTSLRAQLFTVPVFDVSNYIEDLIQVFDIERQLANMVFQAQMLPVNMLARYHPTLPAWTLNPNFAFFQAASSMIGALNVGDSTGAGYKQVVEPLDIPSDVLARMPIALQRRLLDDYATIQLADSVATSSVDQNGSARISGNPLLQIVQNLETDAFSTINTFNSQTALLNKINGASIVGLKEEERTNQFLSSTLEQLVVDNKRKRDTEAKLMNATINEWRYGASYGQSLFSRTAANIDDWRLR